MIKVIISYYLWRKYRIEIHSESTRTIPIHSDICIRVNANNSEPIRNQVFNTDRSGIFNQNKFIWIENLLSDWVGFIRIDVLELIGLSRIDF